MQGDAIDRVNTAWSNAGSSLAFYEMPRFRNGLNPKSTARYSTTLHYEAQNADLVIQKMSKSEFDGNLNVKMVSGHKMP